MPLPEAAKKLPILKLTPQEFRDLSEYSTTLPTGTTPGKRWKRLVNCMAPKTHQDKYPQYWIIGEYGKCFVRPVSGRTVGDRNPNDPKGPLINLQCQITNEIEIKWYRPIITIRALAAMPADDWDRARGIEYWIRAL